MAAPSVVLCLLFTVLVNQAQSVIVKDDLIFGLSGWNGNARTVRKLVHTANWTTLATISGNSQMSQMSGTPMIDIVAVADSPIGGDSTGNIYFYLNGNGMIAQNINNLNNVTALFVKQDNLNCAQQNMNVLTPSCDYAMITGSIMQLFQGTQQYSTAQNAVLSRHPVSSNYLQNNNYYLCQLIVNGIYFFDSNGMHSISVNNYYNDKVFGIFGLEQKLKPKKNVLAKSI